MPSSMAWKTGIRVCKLVGLVGRCFVVFDGGDAFCARCCLLLTLVPNINAAAAIVVVEHTHTHARACTQIETKETKCLPGLCET